MLLQTPGHVFAGAGGLVEKHVEGQGDDVGAGCASADTVAVETGAGVGVTLGPGIAVPVGDGVGISNRVIT